MASKKEPEMSYDEAVRILRKKPSEEAPKEPAPVAMPTGDFSPENLQRGLIILAWLCLNLGLNFYNKWAFTEPGNGAPGAGFVFPIFYTLWNMVASFIGCNLLMALVPSTRTLSKKQFMDNKWGLLVLSTVYVINILSQNASLVHIGLSVNQILKCCVPLPTMLCAFFVQGTRYPWPIIVSVFSVIASATLSVPFSDPSVTTIGVVLTMTSMLCAGVRPVLSALLLANAKQSGLSPIPLLWYDSLFSIFALLILFFTSHERPDLPDFYHQHMKTGIAVVLCGSMMAFAFNIITFYLIKSIGPLTSTVLGNVKTIILVLVATVLLDTTPLQWYNVMGYVLFFFTLFSYSYLNYLKSQKRLKYPKLPFCLCCEPREEGDASSTKVEPAKEGPPPSEKTSLMAGGKQ